LSQVKGSCMALRLLPLKTVIVELEFKNEIEQAIYDEVLDEASKEANSKQKSRVLVLFNTLRMVSWGCESF
jgi:hypothetical protein